MLSDLNSPAISPNLLNYGNLQRILQSPGEKELLGTHRFAKGKESFTLSLAQGPYIIAAVPVQDISMGLPKSGEELGWGPQSESLEPCGSSPTSQPCHWPAETVARCMAPKIKQTTEITKMGERNGKKPTVLKHGRYTEGSWRAHKLSFSIYVKGTGTEENSQKVAVIFITAGLTLSMYLYCGNN